MSFFDSIDLLPNDPIFFLTTLFNDEKRSEKVNLGVGVYNDAEGQQKVLECVRNAESKLIKENLDKNYPPLDGHAEFIQRTLKLIFDSHQFDDSLRVYGAQTLGGTGALRIGSEFLAQNIHPTIFIPSPSWPNHRTIFSRAGMKVHEYPYFDQSTHRLLFSEMCQALQTMPPSSTVLLHTCCHNPTGMDLSLEQWQELSSLIKKQKIIPFFDFAYQGFAENFKVDSKAVHLFLKDGHEMLIAYSFSKNMGLYGERVGLLAMTTQTDKSILPLASQIKQIIRGTYSMPPLHGARVVAAVLASDELTLQWQEELTTMRQRAEQMRHRLADGLMSEAKGLDFSFLRQQKGLFSFCGLSSEQVLTLRHKYAIFMPSNGRINVAGLNSKNIDYVVKAHVNVFTQ